MVVFNKLGHIGRLGNQLFQIASTLGIAEKNNTTAVFNKWDYAHSFNFPQKETVGHVNFFTFREGNENYFRQELFDLKENWQLEGYFQSEKYFSHIKETILNIFSPIDSVRKQVSRKYQLALALEPVAMHVRVGDFKQHGWYVGDDYFLSMCEKFRDRLIVVFSDDIAYCQNMIKDYGNVIYSDDNEVNSLCLMSMCKTHVISNSTFSWWGAWLSQSSEVYYPEWQSGNYPNKDFYPENWIPVKLSVKV